MNIQPTIEIVHCYRQNDWPAVQHWLTEQNFHLILLDGAGIIDKDSFLRQATAQLPLAEGCQPHTWDGFVDCLWGGLYHVASPRVAFVWQSAHVLLQQDLQLFLTINRVLDRVAESVATTENGFSQEMWLTRVLLGEGDMFAQWG